MRFFFSNAPQFLALPSDGGANVPGFGADQKQDNRLISFQDIHIFSPRINEARAGYSFIRGDMSGESGYGFGFGIKRANADAYPGLGSIRIGATAWRSTRAAIGNSGELVDTQNRESSTTLVDILSITRVGTAFARGRIIYYQISCGK